MSKRQAMRAARLALVAVVLLGTLLTPRRPRWSRERPERRRVSGASIFGRTSRSRTPSREHRHSPGTRSAARRATSSSSRRAGRSTGAPSSGRTSPTAPTSGKFCRSVSSAAPAATERSTKGRRRPFARCIAPIRIPATSVNLVLPWFTGKPYALYAHVRAITTRGATAWSKPFGFNMRWEDTPVPLAGEARARSLGRGRRGDRLRRLVPRHPQGRTYAHERGRPARVLQLPPRGQLVAARALARAAGAPGRRRAAERPSRSVVRPVEPDLRDDEPRLVAPESCRFASRSRTRSAPSPRPRLISSCPPSPSPVTRAPTVASTGSSAHTPSRIATA